MFITNIEPNKSTVSLDGSIGKYLETHGVPLLGFDGNKYVFSDTELLRIKIKGLPIGLKLKLMLRGGG
jgi:hypothetical protein